MHCRYIIYITYAIRVDHKFTTVFALLSLRLGFVGRLTVVLLAIMALSVDVSVLLEGCLLDFLEGGIESSVVAFGVESFLSA